MELNYLIVLKTSHKNIDRVDNCVSTWLSSLNYICLTDRITGLYNEWSGSDSDKYESNEEKTVNFINHIRNSSEYDKYDWLVFIDDDAILNVKMFNNIINELDKNKVYGLLISSFKKAPGLSYPSGGSGYFVSPSIIKGKSPMLMRGWGFEDACFGKWCQENNIEISPMPSGIKLNGWFPFQKHWDQLNQQGNSYCEKIIKQFSQEENKFLTSHLTHHYIRWKPLMKYIHELNEKAP